MKKLVLFGLILGIGMAAPIFCASNSGKAENNVGVFEDLYSVASKEITFNKVKYELVYSQEFDGDTIPDEFSKAKYDIENIDPDGDGIWDGRWFDRSRHVVGKQNYPEFLYVENGAVHIIEQHYIDENGLAHQDTGELRSVSFTLEPERNRIKNPALDFVEGYYEIRFKMPRVKGISFWMGTFAETFTGNLSDGHHNSNGYAWHEVDFCEIHNTNGGKKIEPLGGFHIADKNDKKVSNGYEFNESFTKLIAVNKSWYDEWHVMQAVVNKNTMDIYYDGKFFRKVSVPAKFGELVGNYGIFIAPQYSDYEWEDNPDKNKVDWSDTAKHDFQVDYIRYYCPVGQKELHEVVEKKDWLTLGKETGIYNLYESKTANDIYFVDRSYIVKHGSEYNPAPISIDKLDPYNDFGFEFRITDFSEFKSSGYALEMDVKTKQENLGITVGLYNSTSKAAHEWKYEKTITNKEVPADGKWHKVRIPLSSLKAGGIWDNDIQQYFFPEQSKFDWTNVNKLRINNDANPLTDGLEIDNIRIVK